VLQDLVEVEADQEVVVRGKDVAEASPPPAGGEEVIDTGEEGTPKVTQEAPRPRRPRGKIFAVTGVVDVGFRDFSYDGVVADNDPMTPDDLPDEHEGGQVIAGPMIELWPGTIAGVHALRGLVLVARMQFPINNQPVTSNRLMGTTSTFWQSLEISARHRWTIKQKGTLEVGAGFVRDQYQFNFENPNDKPLLPDADYRSIKIGVRGSLLLGSIEPYLAGENRVVLSGGKALEDRFSLGASASGLRGVLGAIAKLGPLEARLEGSLTLYSWTFKYDTNDTFKADGASDFIKIISASIGYAY
jgi:hypothetical protein